MDYILSKKYDETLTINFIGTEKLCFTGCTNKLNLKIDEPINGISKINRIEYQVDGIINDYQYLKVFFKFKNFEHYLVPCDSCWSDELEISQLSGLTLNPNQDFDLELFFYRIDDYKQGITPTDIYISNIVIHGEYDIEKTEELVNINNDNNQIILAPSDIYKVFSVDDFQVIAKGETNNIDIMFRVTENNGRTYSQWEPLTTDNISTFRFNELRFSKIEYLITQKNRSNIPTRVYDIILTGDFQNVSANYLKNNRYGLREDCLSSYVKNNNIDFSCGLPKYSEDENIYNNLSSNNYDLKMNFHTQGLSCYIHTLTTKEIDLENNENRDEFWNPYETNKITSLADKLANDVSNIFSWKVDYHITDPDENGTDMVLHEYQLFNIMGVRNIRIIVPENKFPENEVKMQKFNLDFFDVFEIHILKDEFKNNFGIDKRPSENDIIFFCDMNRLYRVKHAQVFREIMYTGTYWRVILEKYEQKANIRNLSKESEEKLDALTKNTTLDDLFGIEEQEEKDKVSNKKQTKPITREEYREYLNNKVDIIEEHLSNGNFVFSKNYYDLENTSGKKSVSYQVKDNILNKSENRSFISWFNFNNGYGGENTLIDSNIVSRYNIDTSKNYNLLNNYDDTNKVGYRYWYNKGRIIFQINEHFYHLNVTLKTNIWYGVVINLNQRLNKLNINLYKRYGYYDIKMINLSSFEMATVQSDNTTGYTYLTNIGYKAYDNIEQIGGGDLTFELVNTTEIDITPYEFNHNESIEIIGSKIKYTNLRVFNDIIPEDSINNVLNQHIITDEQRLILSDNANRRMYADNFPDNRWD